MDYVVKNTFKNCDEDLLKDDFNRILGKIIFDADNSLKVALKSLQK